MAAYTPKPYHVDADELVECPSCHKRDDTDAAYCDQCGTKLAGRDDVVVLAPPAARSNEQMTLIERLQAEMASAREATRSAEFRADQAEYEIYHRAKYSAADKKDMLKSGHALPNAKGDPSYPIKDEADLKAAISAVGRGTADHTDIRQHIIKHAKKLGKTSLLPEGWDLTTGASKDEEQKNDTTLDAELREAETPPKPCETCEGEGKIMAGKRKCPDCGGSGKATDADGDNDGDERSAFIPVTSWVSEMGPSEVTCNATHEPDYRAAPNSADARSEARQLRDMVAEVGQHLAELSDEEREAKIASYPDPDEFRTALQSYNDIENAVEVALRAKLGDDDGDCDLWVCDCGEGWAVFQSYVDPPGMGCFRVNYSLADSGAVTFTSEPQPVARLTTYQPLPAAQKSLLDSGPAIAYARAAELELERDQLELRRAR